MPDVHKAAGVKPMTIFFRKASRRPPATKFKQTDVHVYHTNETCACELNVPYEYLLLSQNLKQLYKHVNLSPNNLLWPQARSHCCRHL